MIIVAKDELKWRKGVEIDELEIDEILSELQHVWSYGDEGPFLEQELETCHDLVAMVLSPI